MNSGIRRGDNMVTVSTTCAGLYVGLEEIDHGLWDVYPGPVKLGRLFEETLLIEDHLGRLKRVNV
jgi:putative transposase